MLPDAHRIKSAEDFRRVLRSGVKSRSALGVVAVMRRDSAPSRLGIVVSRKVGGAVVRNRTKRRIRHIFAEFVTNLQPVDVVVRCDESAAGLESIRLRRLMGEALEPWRVEP